MEQEETIETFDFNKGKILVENKIIRNQDKLIELLDNGTPFINFVGGVEVDTDVLEEEVPEDFINSKTPVMIEEEYTRPLSYIDEDGEEVITTETGIRMVSSLDKEGEPIMRQMKFKEYCLYIQSLDASKAILRVVNKIGNNYIGCNEKHVKSFSNRFGKENILTKHIVNELIHSEAYTNKEDDVN